MAYQYIKGSPKKDHKEADKNQLPSSQVNYPEPDYYMQMRFPKTIVEWRNELVWIKLVKFIEEKRFRGKQNPCEISM